MEKRQIIRAVHIALRPSSTAYVVMVYRVMAYVVMANVVMAYVVIRAVHIALRPEQYSLCIDMFTL